MVIPPAHAPPLPASQAGGWRRALPWALAAAVVPYLLLSFYCWPANDDFGYWLTVHERGWLGAALYYYQTWSGRYTSHLLLMGYYALGPMELTYRFLPLLLIGLTGLACWCLCSAVLTGRLLSRRALVPALGLLVIFLTHQTSAIEGIYWFPAAWNYTPPSALLLLVVALLLVPGTGGWRGRVQGLGALALTVLAVGGNETTLGLILIVLALGTGLAWRVPHANARWWGWCLAAAVAGTAAVVLAPGNFQHHGDYAAERHLARALWWSGRLVLDSLRSWWLSPTVLGAIILAVPACWQLAGERPWGARLRPWHVAAAALVYLGALASVYLPMVWITSWAPKARMSNCVDFFALIGGGVLLLLVVGVVRQRAPAPLRVHPAWPVLGQVLLLSGLVCTPRSELLPNVLDLVLRAPGYRQQVAERRELIARARTAGQPVLTVPAFRQPPRTVHYLDFTDDPQYPDNQVAASFYGLESLRVDHFNDWVQLRPLWAPPPAPP